MNIELLLREKDNLKLPSSECATVAALTAIRGVANWQLEFTLVSLKCRVHCAYNCPKLCILSKVLA